MRNNTDGNFICYSQRISDVFQWTFFRIFYAGRRNKQKLSFCRNNSIILRNYTDHHSAHIISWKAYSGICIFTKNGNIKERFKKSMVLYEAAISYLVSIIAGFFVGKIIDRGIKDPYGSCLCI